MEVQMKNIYKATALATLLLSSLSFAADQGAVMDSSIGVSCSAVVKACKAGGYERKNQGKRFWKDCMHPLLLGQNVNGVTVEGSKVKACRDKKIIELQNMLTQLQDVK
jgi:hypothetical protein